MSEVEAELAPDIESSPAKEVLPEKVPDVGSDVTEMSPPSTMDTSTSGAVTSHCVDHQMSILCFVLLVVVAMFASLFIETSLVRMIAGIAPSSVILFYFLGV
ncbi:hypothetical protein NP493_525g00000 [Ridgeia piscesae]|uniref:Uncharacterized protein n=1 Tax=Ridgeia piscesae TaxID=27915 RepID=A0AAD9KWJ1_RIDPI|nr:hypothetical protein NP493_525g00000 [Ridgeia piscesae]